MELVINDENLMENEVQEFNSKVRAILIDENNQILVANYGKVILLPGGKVDTGETIYDAIKRELIEELGQSYRDDELAFMATLQYFQKDYPTRDGTFLNRLVKTHYFIGRYKEILTSSQNLTEKEQKDKFRLELISLEDLENVILQNQNDNPRNVYFQKELLMILNAYKNIQKDSKVKKLKWQSIF